MAGEELEEAASHLLSLLLQDRTNTLALRRPVSSAAPEMARDRYLVFYILGLGLGCRPLRWGGDAWRRSYCFTESLASTAAALAKASAISLPSAPLWAGAQRREIERPRVTSRSATSMMALAKFDHNRSGQISPL